MKIVKRGFVTIEVTITEVTDTRECAHVLTINIPGISKRVILRFDINVSLWSVVKSHYSFCLLFF